MPSPVRATGDGKIAEAKIAAGLENEPNHRLTGTRRIAGSVQITHVAESGGNRTGRGTTLNKRIRVGGGCVRIGDARHAVEVAIEDVLELAADGQRIPAFVAHAEIAGKAHRF